MFVEGCWCYRVCRGTEKPDVIIVEFVRDRHRIKEKSLKSMTAYEDLGDKGIGN